MNAVVLISSYTSAGDCSHDFSNCWQCYCTVDLMPSSALFVIVSTQERWSLAEEEAGDPFPRWLLHIFYSKFDVFMVFITEACLFNVTCEVRSSSLEMVFFTVNKGDCSLSNKSSDILI